MAGESASATPEMVNTLGKLDEFELTREGVRPLSNTDTADPSQQASQAGAEAEPANPAPEATPTQTTQTPETPAGQPPAQAAEAAPQPVVTVVPGPTPQATKQPATAETATETAPAVEASKATPEEEAANLGKLGTFLDEQKNETVEAARRAAQSEHDKQSAQFTRQLKESQDRAQELTDKIRDLELRELTEDERTKAKEVYAQQDERTKLDAYRAELVTTHRGVTVDSLLIDYRDFGVERPKLEAIENPEEMELYCEQQKSAFLENKIAEGPAQPVATVQPASAEPVQPAAAQPATTTETPAPAAEAAPAPAAEPNAPVVPAGATAPSDIGTAGSPEEARKFSEDADPAALTDNLRNMRWDRVEIRR